MLVYIHNWTAKGTAWHADAKWAHTQFGIAVMMMLPRLLVRSRRKAPPVVPTPAGRQDPAAKTMHLALYILLIGHPAAGHRQPDVESGWMGFSRHPVAARGGPDRQPAPMLEDIHENSGNLLMYLAALHAAAAPVSPLVPA